MPIYRIIQIIKIFNVFIVAKRNLIMLKNSLGFNLEL